MKGGPFWEMVLDFLAPVTPCAQGMRPFGPLITIFIVSFLAYTLIKGQRRYELLRMETEALVRRYMIFRGKRYGTVGKIKAQKDANKKVLKSISRSWYKFKEYYVEKRAIIENNYRWMKKGFIFGCILLFMGTLWQGVTDLLITKLPSSFFSGLFQSMPSYLLVVVGIALLRSQKEEIYGSPTHQIDPALEAVFADFDQKDSRLSEEFDPLEEEGVGK